MTSDDTRHYLLSASVRMRLLGTALVLLAAIVLVIALLVALLDAPGVVMTISVVVATATVLVGGYALSRRARVVSLDRDGYRVRLVRGAGTRAARWGEVEDVQAVRVGNARCVRLRLRDGRTTTIPVEVLAVDPDVFADDVRDRLDAHLGGSGWSRGPRAR